MYQYYLTPSPFDDSGKATNDGAPAPSDLPEFNLGPGSSEHGSLNDPGQPVSAGMELTTKDVSSDASTDLNFTDVSGAAIKDTTGWSDAPGAGNDPFGGDPWGGDPFGGDPWGGDPSGGDPWGADPWGGDPTGGDPWGADPWGGDPTGGDPWGGDPWGGDPWGGDPWGGDPWGGDPWGGDPWGGYNGFDSGFGDYGGFSDYSGFSDYPVVLDLTGQGINITPLGSSNTFVDMAGDGYQHRTAWAGVGNGVLMLDLNGTGDVDSPRAFNFTSWDPSASSDMEALDRVFDTNENHKLDAGDQHWSSFKVLVTNADGTTTLRTLGELGIASIDLVSDNAATALPDGSTILGKARFTRTDGTTGTAADVGLAFDPAGYVTQKTVTHNADGSTTIGVKAFNRDGNLVNETSGITSADGMTRTLRQDFGGDGVVDDVRTIATVANGDGSRTETVSDFNAVGALTGRTVTTTSADFKSIGIERDADADGSVDQTETRVTAADGSTTVTISDFNANGALTSRGTVTTNADGLFRTDRADVNGDGVFDLTQTDVTVVNGDGSRVETVTRRNADGSLRDGSVTTTGADGRSRSSAIDADGDGVVDLTQVSSIVLNADGTSVTTWTAVNGDGSWRDRTATTLSADARSKTVQTDLDGDGIFDLTSTDVTAENADGSSTRTVTDTNRDGSLRGRTTTAWSADGRSRTIQSDTDGNGQFDFLETVTVGADGASVDTASVLNPDGSLKARTVTTTSADGRATSVARSMNAAGSVELTQTSTTVVNADDSSTTTLAAFHADGSLRDRAVVTASADGLSKTTQRDTTGSGSFNRTETDVVVIHADASRAQTISTLNADGSLRERTVTTLSSDRQTTSVQTDINGDGHVDRAQTTQKNADGSVVATVSEFNANGSLRQRTVATTSADGLSTTTQEDLTGDAVFDRSQTDVTVLNADGSRTQTITGRNADGSLHDKTVITVSANTLERVAQTDRTGDGVFDTTQSDIVVLNADGSRTETVTTLNGDGSLDERTMVTTSATGLSTTTQSDMDGSGAFDRTRTDATVLNSDGSRTDTVIERNADGSLRNRTVTTTSDDGNTVTISRDINGDGAVDRTSATVLSADGGTVTTIADYDANGVLADRSVTTTSANGRSVTIQRDTTGSGSFDQTRTDVTVLNADGSTTGTIVHLNADGSVRDRTVVTTSDDGLTKTTQWDATGSGSFNLTETDVTVLHADGGQTHTLSHIGANGALKDRTTLSTSADSNTTNMQIDRNGDGVIDQQLLSARNADGSLVTTASDFNPNGTLKDRAVVTKDASGLSITTQRDTDGNGGFDQTQTDVTVLHADGSRTRTVMDFNADGSLRDRIITTTSANGLTTTTAWEGGGASAAGQPHSRTDVTAVNADGSTVQTVTDLSAAGAVTARHSETVSANGLSKTKHWDTDGNGSVDQSATGISTFNADGSRTDTLTAFLASGAVKSRSVVTVSADGRSTTTTTDANGDGAFEQTQTRVAATNADGSGAETLTVLAADGSVKSRMITTTSADGRTVTMARDANGDGRVDQSESTVSAVDGSRVSTVSNFGVNGILKDRATITTSTDGLTTTTHWDLDGNGSIDRTRSDVTVANLDGSRVQTLTDTNSNGALHQRGILTTSADGRSKTLQKDTTGAGYFDHIETTTVSADGSSVTDTRNLKADGSLIDRSITTVSADGRSKTVQTDTQGDGVYDYTETTRTDIDGTKVSSGVHLKPDGSVQDRVVTTVSADGLTKTIQTDSTNAGWFDRTVTEVTRVDGSVYRTALELNADGSTKSKTNTVESANGETTYVDVGAGNDSVFIDGKSPINLLSTDGVITVASGSSVTIEGSGNVVLAEGGAQVSTNGSNNRVFTTNASVFNDNSIQAQNAGSTHAETGTGFTYTNALGQVKTYYVGHKMDLRHFDFYGDPYVNWVFLNQPGEYIDDVSVYGDGFVAFDNFEGLGTIVLAGGSTPVTLVGGTGGDDLWGGDGNDFIFGGANATEVWSDGFNSTAVTYADTLYGGGGNDTIYMAGSQFYQLDPYPTWAPHDPISPDFHWVDGEAGYDTVVITTTGSVTIALADRNFEAIVSNDGNDVLYANPGAAAYIDGRGGNDTITGSAFSDTLFGGSGDDVIYAGDADDLIVGGAGQDHFDAGGGNDILDGGVGADHMGGGAGDDIYLVDDLGDVIYENSNEGSDTAKASVNYTIGSVYLETLALIEGSGATSATGNHLDNTLIGNSGNNVLDGKAGNDVLVGGFGNDTYYVDAADAVVENADGGSDTVNASLSYALNAHVENLNLLEAGAIDGSGNNLSNVIVGNSANNVLSGGGGHDRIVGGAGSDTAAFSGSRSDYLVAYNAPAHAFTVTDLRAGAPEGVDTVSGVEFLRFGGTTIALGNVTQTVQSGDGTSTVYSWTTQDQLNWLEKAVTYDGLSRKTGESLEFADGTRSAAVFDAVASRPWSSRTSVYDASDQLVSLAVVNDDGTKSATVYDTATTQPWSSWASTSDAAGHPTSLTIYGDGGGPIFSLDATDVAAWSPPVGGAGTSTVTVTDSADAYEWGEYASIHAASGNLLTEAGTLDNGGHWLNAYDAAGAANWSWYTNAYNAAGTLLWQSGTTDSGMHWLNIYDIADAYAWSEAKIVFDADWNVVTQIGVNDNDTYSIDAIAVNEAFDALVWSVGPYEPSAHMRPQPHAPNGGWNGTPVILDLDGNGFDVALRAQTDGEGQRVQTTSIGTNDGYLFIDLNDDGGSGPDGLINQLAEADFTQWSGAASNLAALDQVFDTNANGALDAGDARWSEFRVWRDANGDGVAQTAELRTLNELGIASIDLVQIDRSLRLTEGAATGWASSYTLAAGGTRAVGDLALTKAAIAAAAGEQLTTVSNIRLNADASTTADIGVLNAGGSLHDRQVTTTASNGSRADSVLDTNGDQAFDVQKSIVLNGDGTTTIDTKTLNAAGVITGEVARVLSPGGAVISTSTSSFNGAGRITFNTIVLAGGAHTDTVYDADDTQPWSSQVSSYDAAGNLVSFTTNYDNGSSSTAPTGATLSGGTVAENAANGAGAGIVTGIDPDAGAVLTYQLTGDAGGRFAIDASTGLVTVANGALLNYEAATSHQITVRTTDQSGLFVDKSFTIAVTNLNEAPTNATLSGATVVENAVNGTIVGNRRGHRSGRRRRSLTYSLLDAAGGRFAVNGTSGLLTVANGALLDHEAATSHAVTVRVTDQNGLTFDKVFTIAVTNVNEAPNGATLTNASVAENSANGAMIGTVVGSDPDAGAVLSYALTANAGGRFAINASTGVLTVAAGVLLNYEAATSHAITVQMTDQNGLTFDKSFTIAVTNVNEAPTNATLSNTSVAENATNGTFVGTVAGSDPDAGAVLSYSLIDNAGGRFAVNAGGTLTVANGTLLNYEAATSHAITVRVTDQNNLTFDKAFTITVANVNEAPTNITLSGGTVAENAANGTAVGTASGVDPDAGRAQLLADRQCERALRHQHGERRRHGGERRVAQLRGGGRARHHGARHRYRRNHARPVLHYQPDQRQRCAAQRHPVGRHGGGECRQRHRGRHRHRLRPGRRRGPELRVPQQCRRALRHQRLERRHHGGERGAAQLRGGQHARRDGARHRSVRGRVRQGPDPLAQQRQRDALRPDSCGRRGGGELRQRQIRWDRDRLRPGCRRKPELRAHQQRRRAVRHQRRDRSGHGRQRRRARLPQRDRARDRGARDRPERGVLRRGVHHRAAAEAEQRFQRRRQGRHPVAAQRRLGVGLAHERLRHCGRKRRRPLCRHVLGRGRIGRLQRRRQVRHSVPGRRRHAIVLVHGRVRRCRLCQPA